MTGLDCDSDHRLLSVSFMNKCKQPWGHRPPQNTNVRIPRLEVSRLQDTTVQDKLNSKMIELVHTDLASDAELWQYALRKSAEYACGDIIAVTRPVWQQDNAHELAELARRKQTAFAAKDTSLEAARQYHAIKKANKKRVRAILNTWWDQKAQDIQLEVNTKSPNYQFAGYKQLRKVFTNSRRPTAKLRDTQGTLLPTRDERVRRWEEHFSSLLNIETKVDQTRLTNIATRPVDNTLGSTPSFAEMLAAVSQLKKGKAPGPDGIQPEMIMFLNTSNLRILYEMLARVWEGVEPMPAEWKANYLVPLPKSGDTTRCDRWRGIILSSVVGKVFSRIINGRLQHYIEKEALLPETQCGFRPGRGTLDMVFTLRMALEIARVKSHPLYVVFVDLAKAYDSVCRETLWTIMEKKGIPPHLITLIRDFYTGKGAKISVEGVLSKSIDLSTGLGQGCCMAPTLFNLFLSAVMEDWYTSYQDHMVWGYRLDGMDDRTMGKYTSWDTINVHDLGYADDAAFIADTLLKLQALTQDLQHQYLGWGLHMSVRKTEAMATQEDDNADIHMQTDPEGYNKVKFTQGFKYLGSQISRHGGCEDDIQARIDAARKAFWRLTSSVGDVWQISSQNKLRVYRACVLSVLLYGAEAWTTTFTCRARLEKFQMMCLRKITHVSRWQQEQWHMSNDVLRDWLGTPTIKQMVTPARLRWLGHVARMPDHRLPKQMMFAFLPPSIGTIRQPGRREGKWLQMEYVSDLRTNGIPIATWAHTARNSSQWRHTVFQSAPFFHPHWPRRGQDPPASRNSRTTSLKPQKLSFMAKTEQWAAELHHITEEHSWIRLETELGGRAKVHDKLIECYTQQFGQDWFNHPEEELGEFLLDTQPWMNAQESTEDCVIARLALRSLLHKYKSGLTDVCSKPPAWRLSGKRPAAQLHQPPAGRTTPNTDAPTRVPGVKIKKKFEHRFRVHESGDFPCTLCNRFFTTGTALATHVRTQHREGTFREHGFACP